MTRLDTADAATDISKHGADTVLASGPQWRALPWREVPLGGLRDMSVRRALPQRDLPTIGAWCFLDRFGPQRVTMRVDPHPHIGLQTVTWPLTGHVRHRDSLGSDLILDPGALNIMTSGHGIAHSEYSIGDGDSELDALQLWVALPEHARHGPADFESHRDLPQVTLTHDDQIDAVVTVVLGTFAGTSSPATAHTPIVGAQINMARPASVTVPLQRDWEHGIVVLDGEVRAAGAEHDDLTVVDSGQLLYVGTGRDHIELTTAEPGRVFMIGGKPLEEDLVMWWNFVGRNHDEVADARAQWEAGSSRFGTVAGHGDTRIPAPPLPGVRLTPRRRR